MRDDGAQPRVSVILCVYNGERFLSSTLDSIWAQTYAGYEVIAVDDGSTDASSALLETRGDPRLRVIHQSNQGTAGALSTGLRFSRGEYIAFLDQDDLWDPESLATHVAFLDAHPEVQLSFCWFRVIDETGADIGLRSRRHRGQVSFQALLEDFVIGGSSNIVARRSALAAAGDVDVSFRRIYDLDLCLRVALLGAEAIEAIPRDLMFYRRHSSQITRHLDELRKEWDRLIEKMRGLAPREVAAVESRARCNINRYFARLAYEGAAYRKALALTGEGFRNAPAAFVGDPRNWLTLAACLSGFLLPAKLHATLERMAGLHRRQS